MSSHFGLLPLTSETVVVSPAGVSTVVTGLKRGVKYRVVATAAVNIAIGAKSAVTKKGLYLPANVVDYIMVGMADSQGTDAEVYVLGTADVYFTPVVSVVAG